MQRSASEVVHESNLSPGPDGVQSTVPRYLCGDVWPPLHFARTHPEVVSRLRMGAFERETRKWRLLRGVLLGLGREPLRGDGVTKYAWTPMLKRLGLPPVKLHGARHTCATLLFEAGQEMKDVQEILGHSSIAVTADIYSHVSRARRRRSADALAEYLDATE